ncbi:hypothetical protein HELRODRAFT_181995 [Helobdella robusta]|uniref:Uncharacterized protein n=1 Tax=Helobdella robusta TaxID=6412 RepID=T1FHL0_HELRO|nr:hypothetical protein HELRODRAFT_181995 [Helobdella robusta]ESN91936.1 hypothetical protein HELRODRAFT_181995 [Helobdella robusta]
MPCSSRQCHWVDISSFGKDKGLSFQDSLTFLIHIRETFNTSFMLQELIQKNFKYLTKKSFILLHKTLMRSKLEIAARVSSPWQIDEIKGGGFKDVPHKWLLSADDEIKLRGCKN